MHDVEFEHFHATPEEAEKLSDAIWRVENVILTTVGIDIGSSTSHFMISRVHLQRAANALSSRFIVVGRDELWRSPVLLTPYRDDYSIDAKALHQFLRDGFAAAGTDPAAIDTGAVILTGEALKRRNARAIAELFAEYSGRFVCASAGHHLECMLAAQGSGAAALSRKKAKVVLNVDIGGGTTKLGLISNGTVVSTAAVAVGGRLVAWDADGSIVRLEEAGKKIGRSLGLDLRLGRRLADAERRAMARSMCDTIVRCIRQEPLSGDAASLMLTEPLARTPQPEIVTFSGGVAEFLFGREKGRFGDLGPALAHSLEHRLGHHEVPAEVWDAGQGLRATVVGASQFTVQVSGNTIHVSSTKPLPISNLPVVSCALDLQSETVDEADVRRTVKAAFARHDLLPGRSAAAIALSWKGTPSHVRLHAVAAGVANALKGRSVGPVVLLIDGDVGRSLGRILSEEVMPGADVISIDGLQLRDFDFVDIGTRIEPAGVVPVIIKSLLFPAAGG